VIKPDRLNVGKITETLGKLVVADWINDWPFLWKFHRPFQQEQCRARRG
tara:strand:- start:905 stop:1051 length:147 start_codon:yes stop_codon:yes gene_type:complete